MTESILVEAERIINGQRRIDYGGCFVSFDRVAKLWSTVLDTPVTAEQVALCMIQLKVTRAMEGLTNGSLHRDSVVDMAGYAGCLEKIDKERHEG